jgi:hypothetical protein
VPNPDDLFDELEVMIALAVLDVRTDLTGDFVWMPPGRFAWRRSFHAGAQPGHLFNEAEAEGEEWAPLRAGWFGGHRDRFAAVKTAFENLVAKERSLP